MKRKGIIGLLLSSSVCKPVVMMSGGGGAVTVDIVCRAVRADMLEAEVVCCYSGVGH